MEVIYTGLRQTRNRSSPRALQEDADPSACRSFPAPTCTFVPGDAVAPRQGHAGRARGSRRHHPDVDIPKLNEIGIKGIFLPGTPMQDIVDFINRNTRSRVEA
jgi:methylmalonyl-CoA mutase C-terminal domain/subunit